MLMAEELIGPWYQPPFQISTPLKASDMESELMEYVARKASQEICEQEDQRILGILRRGVGRTR